MILQIKVQNCTDLENEIKTLFKQNFVQKTNYGIEYFEGNEIQMRKSILQLVEKAELKSEEDGEVKVKEDQEVKEEESIHNIASNLSNISHIFKCERCDYKTKVLPCQIKITNVRLNKPKIAPINDKQCSFCLKTFSRKNDVRKHQKLNRCKKLHEIGYADDKKENDAALLYEQIDLKVNSIRNEIETLKMHHQVRQHQLDKV